MNDFCQGHQEAFPGEAAWTLDLENSRNSLGRRRKGISGRKNSMCAQRQRVVEASGVFWNLWESGCLCGHMGCGARWAWLRLTQMSWD